MKFRAAFAIVVGVLLASAVHAQGEPGDGLSRVDHLIYATPDLERTVDELERRLGVRATPAGSSPGRGTRSALLSLGPLSYLEIVTPDPRQPPPSQPPWWIQDLRKPRLVQWAASGMDLEILRAAAVESGVPLGKVLSGRRLRPDNVLLTWRFTSPRPPVADGVVPFLIDWGASPHPALSSAQGAHLVALRAEHPDFQRVQGLIRKLGLDVRVTRGSRPALIATLRGPRGRVVLK